MSSLKMLNDDAELARKSVAMAMNVNAAKGLMEVLRTNLGPKGTLKMCAPLGPPAPSAKKARPLISRPRSRDCGVQAR